MHSSLAARRRVAVVVPRFGKDVVGGAELLGRSLAERLAARGDFVEVLTTCARDHHAWTNDLPAGVEEPRRGLVVRRFRLRPRDLGIYGELSLAIQRGASLSRDEELLWLRHGASSAELEDFVTDHASDYDVVLAMPYLFGTTYFTHASVPGGIVVVPCLHDEPYARLAFVSEMLRGARGIFFNTEAEARLGEAIAAPLAPHNVVGMGIELTPASRPPRLPRRMRGRPLLLYVGRREGGKNSPLLIDYFLRYKQRRDGDVILAFTPPGAGDDLPKHPDIVEIEPQWGTDAVYRSATIFCQPSTNESFSIVLLQAWLAECPAVVHADCAVTREHCERSGGGLWFRNYAEFEAILDRLLGDPALVDVLGRRGRAYVEREYSWPAVLARFDAAVASLDRRAPTAASPSPTARPA